MPSLYEAGLRHARHYSLVAKQADQLYKRGGDSMLVGLKLFDQERAQIDAGWAWARAGAGQRALDYLLLIYAETTAHIGYLRYNKRHERIWLLEAQAAAARRLGEKEAEGNALGNLGITYRQLGDVRRAI